LALKLVNQHETSLFSVHRAKQNEEQPRCGWGASSVAGSDTKNDISNFSQLISQVSTLKCNRAAVQTAGVSGYKDKRFEEKTASL